VYFKTLRRFTSFLGNKFSRDSFFVLKYLHFPVKNANCINGGIAAGYRSRARPIHQKLMTSLKLGSFRPEINLWSSIKVNERILNAVCFILFHYSVSAINYQSNNRGDCQLELKSTIAS